LLVFCVFHQNRNHGGCQGDMAQILAQWQHLVASSIALDVLHQAMSPALHQRIPMVIKIASNVPAFFAWLILLSPLTVANDHVTVIVI
jgi:hypothetical protein